jgi:two-component system, OmpR family, sensor kinase
MKRRPSLRSMLIVPMAATITVGFTAFGVYVDRVESRSRIADVDEELARAETGARRAVASLDDDTQDAPVAAGGAGGGVQLADGVEPPVQLVVTTGGDIVAAAGSPNPFEQSTIDELVRLRGNHTVVDGTYRTRVSWARQGLVTITALPLDAAAAAIADLRRALVAGGLVIIALQVVIVWFLTTSLVRPVTRMTDVATRVADGELDTEVGAASGSRETVQLAVDLDRMLARLRSTIADRERSADEAMEARDDMQRFLADASHELRTPLTALRGYSDLFAQGMLSDPETLDRAMRRIGCESIRLHGLVDNMLQLARNGSTDDPVEVFDPAEVVGDVVFDLRSAYPNRQIEFDLDVAAGTTLLGSPTALHRAVLNLGSNACQHTDRDPIHVDVRSNGSSVAIRVIDHGPGIDRREVDRIFLPFTRLESSRTRANNGGAGLGLALTKQIVEQHHGHISVVPTHGGGATFELAFPTARMTV